VDLAGPDLPADRLLDREGACPGGRRPRPPVDVPDQAPTIFADLPQHDVSRCALGHEPRVVGRGWACGGRLTAGAGPWGPAPSCFPTRRAVANRNDAPSGRPTEAYELGDLVWILPVIPACGRGGGPRPARDGSAASHLEGLMLTMQSDHLLPLVPDMVPQPGPKDNQPRQAPGRFEAASSRRAMVCRRFTAMFCS
jgi:hypothetical protein